MSASAAGESEPIRPYRVLDTAARRRAALVYLALAVVGAVLVAVTSVSAMWLTAVLPLVIAAGLHVAGGWRMAVKDIDAIRIASDHASFEVGHGSATLGFRGALAKPVWQVLVFADGPAPNRQALVTVDALSGDVRGAYEEPVSVP